MLNRASALFAREADSADKIAIRFEGGETSFATLAGQVRQMAGALAALDIGRGVHVGLLLPASPEFIPLTDKVPAGVVLVRPIGISHAAITTSNNSKEVLYYPGGKPSASSGRNSGQPFGSGSGGNPYSPPGLSSAGGAVGLPAIGEEDKGPTKVLQIRQTTFTIQFAWQPTLAGKLRDDLATMAVAAEIAAGAAANGAVAGNPVVPNPSSPTPPVPTTSVPAGAPAPGVVPPAGPRL